MIYFVPIFLCFVSGFSRELSHNRYWYVLLISFLCLFYCCGYMTGSDWKYYELLYDSIDLNQLFYGYNKEPGYYIYMLLFKLLHVGFWPFFIITKTLVFLLVVKTIFDYTQETGYISLMYFLPWFGVYLFIDNPMRNLIAIAIFMLSVKYIIQRRFWNYLLCVLVASLFHFTALLMLPFYAVLTLNVKRWVYVCLFIVVNVVFANRDFLVLILSSMLKVIPYLQDKVITYFIMDSAFAQGKVFSVGMLWQFFLFALLICGKNRLINGFTNKEHGMFVFNCAMVYFILLRFAMSIQVIGRFQLYFATYTVVAIGMLVLSFKYLSRVPFAILLLIISCYTCWDKITGSARYIPYSNYMEYAIRCDFPSFSKRYYYNIDNSPYTNEIDIDN